MWREPRQEGVCRLGRAHGEDDVERPSIVPGRCPIGQRRAAALVVPAIEVELAAGRQQRDQRTMPQTLQSRRPFDAPQALSNVGWLQHEAAEMLDRGDGETGVVELVAPWQAGQRQIERRAADVTKAAVARFYPPLVAGAEERGPRRGCAVRDSACGIRRLRSDHRWNASSEYSRLLAGDLGHRIAEKIGMVERDRRHRAHRRATDDIRGVEPAAKPDLEQHDVGCDTGESEKRRRRRNLEEGDRTAGIDALHFGQQFGEKAVLDKRAGDANALVKAHEMW